MIVKVTTYKLMGHGQMRISHKNLVEKP